MLSDLEEPRVDTWGFRPGHVPLETGTTCLSERRKFGHGVSFPCLALGGDSSHLQLWDISVVIIANTYAAFTMGQVLSLALLDITIST